MIQLESIIKDRGSKYSVSGGPVQNKEDVDAFLKALKTNKKYAKATHNTWGVILQGMPLKSDDGESGAGMVILQMLQGAGRENEVVVVTRWYGGKHLGADRFRHVQNAVRQYLDITGAN